MYAMNLDAQIQKLKHTASKFCSARNVARTLADTRLDYVEQVCMMQQGKKEDKLREQIPRGKMDMAGAGRSNESMDSPRSNRSNKV
jgi:hypothetical protein